EGVVLFIILILYIRKARPAGSVAGLFLLAYGVFRFIVEFAREPDAHLGLLSLGLSMGQLLSLPMIFAGTALITYAYRAKAPSQAADVKQPKAKKNKAKKNVTKKS
ncbi:MAG: phosphatidylglycerol:prolipoprotein diacylglycerol transferase, partial [Psychromonas sp.]